MTDADLLHNPYAELTLKRHRKEGRRPLPSRAAAFFFACSTRLHTQSTNQSKTNLIYAMLFLMLSCFTCVCDVVLSQIIAMYMFYVYHPIRNRGLRSHRHRRSRRHEALHRSLHDLLVPDGHPAGLAAGRPVTTAAE